MTVSSAERIVVKWGGGKGEFVIPGFRSSDVEARDAAFATLAAGGTPPSNTAEIWWNGRLISKWTYGVTPIIVPEPPVQVAGPIDAIADAINTVYDYVSGTKPIPVPNPVGDALFGPKPTNVPAIPAMPPHIEASNRASLGGTMNLSAIASRLPAVAVQVIRAVGGRWSSMPGWIRTLLIGLGLNEGMDIFIDDSGPAFNDLLPSIGGGSSSGGGITTVIPNGVPWIQAGDSYVDPQHGLVVGMWNANGTPFVKFADGWQAAYSRRRNSWRYWKPKKPIVLFADGASNPQDAARAYKALKKQAQRLRPMVDQFTRRSPRRKQTRETRPDGTTIIHVE